MGGRERSAQEVAVKAPQRAGAAAVAEGPEGRKHRRAAAEPRSGRACSGWSPRCRGDRTGPTIVFLGVATEPTLGRPGLWVELAREWAMLGLRSVARGHERGG